MMEEYDDDFYYEEDKINQFAIPVNLSESSNLKEDENDIVETECIFNDLRKERYDIHYQDLLGMTVTSGSVTLSKDEKNLIGISIGGGSPMCPCVYIVQIFDNTPASRDATLKCGDEVVGVNGQPIKGKTKLEVAKMIQAAKGEVTINYNKLHADPKQGKSLDIIMKKIKHRFVENMSSVTADALGLSRAILCNDALVAKLKELRETEAMYKRLVEHAKRMLKSYFDLLQTYRQLGDIFAGIGVREPQTRASEAFTKFGEYHRLLEKEGIKMLKDLKPILADMGTYLNKAIPDTKLTIRKYADTKFEYLSFCLKVKEMDDEDLAFNDLREPLYRLETGNYEYRLILRCRQEARAKFARFRSDVMVKLELLDNKKTQDVAYQLRRFINGLAMFHNETVKHLKEHSSLFPVEVDLSQNAFQYKSTAQFLQESQEDEDIEYGREIQEHYDENDSRTANLCQNDDKPPQNDSQEKLLPDLTEPTDNKIDNVDNLTLLSELGLDDASLAFDSKMSEFGEFQKGLMDDFMPKDGGNNDVFDKLLNELNSN